MGLVRGWRWKFTSVAHLDRACDKDVKDLKRLEDCGLRKWAYLCREELGWAWCWKVEAAPPLHLETVALRSPKPRPRSKPIFLFHNAPDRQPSRRLLLLVKSTTIDTGAYFAQPDSPNFQRDESKPQR